MARDSIPAEIRREVLVEAGHRCAIPTCRYPHVEIHHIVPWEICKSHDFENLIALCANCHRRADSGEIDRKALYLYKSRLSAAIGVMPGSVIVSRRPVGQLSEVRAGNPGYEFHFEYPVFDEPDLAPVTTELEAWANQLLQEHRREHALDEPYRHEIMRGPNTVAAAFEIARHDLTVLSIKFRLVRYRSGAAHATGLTVTRSYLKKPVYRLELANLFLPRSEFLELLSRISRKRLLEVDTRDESWVNRGTQPEPKCFRAFNLTPTGILLTFDEYQVDCFGAGPQVVDISYGEFRPIVNVRLPKLWSATGL